MYEFVVHLHSLLILCSISALAVAVLIAIGVFLIELRWHVDALLCSNCGEQTRLKLEVSGHRVAWTLHPDPAQQMPYFALLFAALAGAAAAAIDTLLFAKHSTVPLFWYISGTVASTIALLIPFAAAGLFHEPLRRSISRALMERVDERKGFEADTLLEIYEIAQEIANCYDFLGLRTKTDFVCLCRRVLFQRAWPGNDAVRSQLSGIKRRAEYELHNIRFLAALFADARIALNQAKVSLQGEQQNRDIARIEKLLYSKALADGLQDARWEEASVTLKNINADLARLLDVADDEPAMPRSKEEACRTLNVSKEAPLEHVKAVVKAYWRVWHPDLARDAAERERYTLRIQQINVAWTILQKDALERERVADAAEHDPAS
jgi:hypothetical protein